MNDVSISVYQQVCIVSVFQLKMVGNTKVGHLTEIPKKNYKNKDFHLLGSSLEFPVELFVLKSESEKFWQKQIVPSRIYPLVLPT